MCGMKVFVSQDSRRQLISPDIILRCLYARFRWGMRSSISMQVPPPSKLYLQNTVLAAAAICTLSVLRLPHPDFMCEAS